MTSCTSSSKCHKCSSALLLACIFAVLLLSYWLLVKIIQLKGLNYGVDIFLHLQSLRNFFVEGIPFVDRYYQPHSYNHNYFSTLIIAPFVYLAGAPALFVIHLLLIFYSFYRTASTLGNEFAGTLVLATLIFGPIGFWIFDDHPFGWHPELLFFPLGILFAISLACRKKISTFIWGALLVCNREDGAILACCINLQYIFYSHMKAYRFDRGGARPLISQVFKCTLFWLLLFLSGMLLLKNFATGGALRLDVALGESLVALMRSNQLIVFVPMVLQALVLLCSGLIFYMLGLSRWIFATSLLCVGIAAIPGLVGSAFHLESFSPVIFENTDITLSWQPRFTLLWTVIVVGIIYALLIKKTDETGRLIANKWFITVLLASIFLQSFTLFCIRGYFIPERFFPFKNSAHQISNFQAGARSFLNCLSDRLEDNATLFGSCLLNGQFASYDWIPGVYYQLVSEAELILCAVEPPIPSCSCAAPVFRLNADDFQALEFQGLYIGYKKSNLSITKQVQSCLLSTEN